ncbi:unnamed protein product [Albugo candida]|uniref:Protein YIF1 n=1 Tax=Albugo candida TaxID=65357 RepID=A0A024GGU5_9STRA|nr:unnamed protein product [Albugo candida]|eukprot:CCI45565.1 unnamed protein product [Albugo candida]
MRHSAIDSKRHRLTPLRDRAIRRDGFDLKAEDHIHHQTLLFPLQRHPPTGMKTISIISFPQIEHHHSNLVFLHNTIRNPMAGVAMSTASDFLQKQSQAYIPGAYGVWGRLKHYFTVDNNYVKNRLKILLFPFWHKNWRRIGDTTDPNQNKYAPPINDINAPDLYIPLMGFLTYILIVGYTKGASNQFSPDVIGADASYCLVMQLIEVAILASFLYLLNSSVSFLDLIAFSGYKYTSLVIDTICYQLFGSLAYYGSLIYTGIALSYFTLNCMKGSVPEPISEKRSFRNYVLFGVSCLQLVLVCFISYTTAPRL